MDYVEQMQAAMSRRDLLALRALVQVVGELPEDGNGSIQGWELNATYAQACNLLGL